MTIVGVIAWIIFGGIAGWIASLITRTDQGLVADVVVGIIGAVVGGFIMQALGGAGATGFNFYSLLVALLGAVVLLAIVNLFRRNAPQA